MKILLLLLALSAAVVSCQKEKDLQTNNPPAPVEEKGFVALLSEYTDAGVLVKRDSSVKVCKASGAYLENLKSLYYGKPNDTLRGFVGYKVMEYRFSQPYCK